MRFQLGKVEVGVSFWFFASILLFLMTDREALALPVLLAVCIHESGHLIYLWWCRLPVCRAEFSFSGMRLHLSGDRPLALEDSIVLNLAGCAFNLVAAVILGLLGGIWLLRLSAVNTAVAIFNLLPIQGLDGGAVLKEVLMSAFGWERGQQISGMVQKSFCLLAAGGTFILAARQGFSPGACFFGILFLAGLFSSAGEK